MIDNLEKTSLLGPFQVVDFVQMACQGSRTVCIQVAVERGVGLIHVVMGDIWDATLGALAPEDALASLLYQPATHFAFQELTVPGPRRLTGSWQGLLLELARRHDEATGSSHSSELSLSFGSLEALWPEEEEASPIQSLKQVSAHLEAPAKLKDTQDYPIYTPEELDFSEWEDSEINTSPGVSRETLSDLSHHEGLSSQTLWSPDELLPLQQKLKHAASHPEVNVAALLDVGCACVIWEEGEPYDWSELLSKGWNLERMGGPGEMFVGAFLEFSTSYHLFRPCPERPGHGFYLITDKEALSLEGSLAIMSDLIG